jgi:archaellum component FlaC
VTSLGGRSGDIISKSEIINKTTGVPFDEGWADYFNKTSDIDSVFIHNSASNYTKSARAPNMASKDLVAVRSDVTQPSFADVMECLKGIDGRLCNMDKRLDALEDVKRKVDTFDTEIKKLLVALEAKYKKVASRVTIVEEKVECSDFAVGMLNDKVLSLEKERDVLKRRWTIYFFPIYRRSNQV